MVTIAIMVQMKQSTSPLRHQAYTTTMYGHLKCILRSFDTILQSPKLFRCTTDEQFLYIIRN